MKKLLHFSRFFVALVAMMSMSVSQMWGAVITSPYTATFASGDLNTQGGTVTKDSVAWSYPAVTYVTYVNDKGMQIGSSKNPNASCTFSTAISNFGTTATITKVTINASMGSKGDATYDISVGGSSKANGSLTTSNAAYSTPAISVNSGNIEITLAATERAYYIKSITVEFTSGGTDPELSVSPAKIDFGSVEVGSSVEGKDVAVTMANIEEVLIGFSSNSPFEVDKESLTESGTITITPTATTLASVGDYADTLLLTDGDALEKTVAVSIKVTEPVVEKGVSFERDWSAYTDWTDNNFLSKQTGSITAHVGTYYGTTGGKASGYMATKNKVNPDSIYFYVSKQSNNTTASTWTLQVSTDSATWTDVKTQDAASMDKGTWVEVKEDLSSYTGVYVRIYYSGSTAVRNIDDVILTTRELTSSLVSKAGDIENGDVTASTTAGAVTFGTTQVKEGTTVTLSNTPAAGYKLKAYKVFKTGDETTKVTVTDGKFTMPAYPVTVSAEFELAKVLTKIELSGDYKTEFWKGEQFDKTGVIVTATYEDASTADVTEQAKFSEPNMTLIGEPQTVEVTYTEGAVSDTTSYAIIVKSIANDSASAYTTAEAIAIINAGIDLSDTVFVKGVVSKVDSYNSTYKSIQYWLDDNTFEIYSGKGIGGADFKSKNDIQVGDSVIVKGNIKKYNKTYEMDRNNQLVKLSRPNVLQSIALSGDTIREFTVGDEFSHEGMIVTATYSSQDPADVTASAVWTGYNMTVANTYTVTVSYTEGDITKTADYQIVVKPGACSKPVFIAKGEESHGTFTLSISGDQCAEQGDLTVVVKAQPEAHYSFTSVTSLKGAATIGTIGAIKADSCVITAIADSTTITAIFTEDPQFTASFTKGAIEATGTAPEDITDYAGEEITLPANPFQYAGHTFAGWSDGEETYKAGAAYTLNENVTFTAQWEELSEYASIFTSNVTLSEKDSVVIDSKKYTAIKTGTSKAAGTATITIPAKTIALHFHACAWKGDDVTLTIKNGETVLESFDLVADDGASNNSPYTLQGNCVEEQYFKLNLSGITAETELTITATSGKRFILYGVNAVDSISTAVEILSAMDRDIVTKVFHNNQVIIIRNGVIYNACGQRIQ